MKLRLIFICISFSLYSNIAVSLDSLYPLSDPLIEVEGYVERLTSVSEHLKKISVSDGPRWCTFFHLSEKPIGFVIEKVIKTETTNLGLPKDTVIGYRLITQNNENIPSERVFAISAELATAVHRLWEVILSSTSVKALDPIQVGGSMSIFGARSSEILFVSGKTYTMESDSSLGQMVLLGIKICNMNGSTTEMNECHKLIEKILKLKINK